MDNPTTLLVAIMFVTILAIAIGNILMAYAEIAGGLRRPMPERIQLSWIFLQLFVLLSLFWETTAILDVDDWLFVEFLYVIAGPMVLLFATSVITAPAQDEQGGESHSHYFGLCRRYFVMLALHEIWILGIDYWYANLNMMSLVSVALLILFLVLAVSRSLRVHVTGASLAWAGYIVSLVLQTLETTGAQ
jgi:hypothetical protein